MRRKKRDPRNPARFENLKIIWIGAAIFIGVIALFLAQMLYHQDNVSKRLEESRKEVSASVTCTTEENMPQYIHLKANLPKNYRAVAIVENVNGKNEQITLRDGKTHTWHIPENMYFSGVELVNRFGKTVGSATHYQGLKTIHVSSNQFTDNSDTTSIATAKVTASGITIETPESYTASATYVSKGKEYTITQSANVQVDRLTALALYDANKNVVGSYDTKKGAQNLSVTASEFSSTDMDEGGL